MQNTFYNKNIFKSKEIKEAIGVIHKAFEVAVEKSNFDILSVILDASKKLDEMVKTGSLQECHVCINLAFWHHAVGLNIRDLVYYWICCVAEGCAATVWIGAECYWHLALATLGKF